MVELSGEIRLLIYVLQADLQSSFVCFCSSLYFLCSLEVVGLFVHLLYALCLRRVMRLISVVIQGCWKRVVVNLLGMCCSCNSVRLDLMLSHMV